MTPTELNPAISVTWPDPATTAYLVGFAPAIEEARAVYRAMDAERKRLARHESVC